jgi:hypothetical protein
MLVIARFIKNIECDEQAGGEADGKAGNIDIGIAFIAAKVSEDDLQIVSEHDACLVPFSQPLKCQCCNALGLSVLR